MAWADTLEYNADFDAYNDPADPQAGFYTLRDGYYWDYTNTYAYDSDGNEHIVTQTQAPQSTGSFFGDLWGAVKSYATNQDVVNQALGGLTGYNVRNNPNPDRPISTGNTPPIQNKQNNTVLYIILGVVTIGMITTIVLVSKSKK